MRLARFKSWFLVSRSEVRARAHKGARLFYCKLESSSALMKPNKKRTAKQRAVEAAKRAAAAAHKRRSEASKKGWDTRRKKEIARNKKLAANARSFLGKKPEKKVRAKRPAGRRQIKKALVESRSKRDAAQKKIDKLRKALFEEKKKTAKGKKLIAAAKKEAIAARKRAEVAEYIPWSGHGVDPNDPQYKAIAGMFTDDLPLEKLHIDGTVAVVESTLRHRAETLSWMKRLYAAGDPYSARFAREVKRISEEENVPPREVFTLWWSP